MFQKNFKLNEQTYEYFYHTMEWYFTFNTKLYLTTNIPAVWNSFNMEFFNNNDFVFKYNTTLAKTKTKENSRMVVIHGIIKASRK